MDISNTQQANDDKELAQVLAGINQQVDEVSSTTPATPPPATPPPMPAIPEPPTPAPAPAAPETPQPDMPAPAKVDIPTPTTPPPAPAVPAPEAARHEPKSGSPLDSIKQEALGELRPLVDKLDVSTEEKFDTYLLLLRSTDDKELIAPAHAAAKKISDEGRRAQALLDIIKEIDFLTTPHK